ncbi:conserved hypothetical protein [Candidatus Sulfotelmatomonas gaucii]|uniref:CopG family transcriptional regulator n=1 Tax=Candidatus Sulfuritelmatomonas gaucii TaxID=2043161 RepID=A0A2N9LV69_9BACT|nr:conserved hypothetical protein [Candidatus Sulfotelmatomonas gaucii]
MHNEPMRTTVTIDDEAYRVVTLYAYAKNITLGAALSELVKKASTVKNSNFSRIETAPNGLPVFQSRGEPLTDEMVNAAQEDDFE